MPHTTSTSGGSAASPLRGMNIISLVDGALPALGKALVDLGADVEVPTASGRGQDGGFRRIFQTRGKRLIALEADQLGAHVSARLDDLHALIASPEALAAAGLPNADDLAAQHPALVVALVTDFGLTGPRASWRGTDAVFQALGGVLSRSGEPGAAPLLPPGELFVRSAAIQLAWTVLAAIYRATEGRGGGVLDCSVFEAGAVSLDPVHGMSGSGTPDIVNAYGRPAAEHLYPIYRTKDGFVRLCVLAKGQWAALKEWMGNPSYFQDPELELTQVRQEFPERVLPHIQAFIADRTTDDIVQDCREHRIPASGVLSPADVLVEEHFCSSGILRTVGDLDGRPIVTAEGMARIDGERTGVHAEVPAMPVPADDRLRTSNPDAGPYPLSGVTVLDLGVIVAGPVASELFAELGARVIRVENTGFPDGMRRSFDFSTPSQARGHRGKESLGLDLRSEAGRELFLQLAARADVVISNFKPGTLQRLGLGYDDLQAVNPGIVCVETTAFGDSGPWQNAMGYGPLVRSGGGHTWLWRADADTEYFADGITIFPDHLVGRVCALTALASLLDRRRSGHGARVTVAQCDVGLVLLDEILAAESARPGSATPPGVIDNRRLLPNVVLPAAGEDQWCIVDPQNAEQFDALCELLEADHSDVPRALAEWVRERVPDEAAALLQARGVPAARMIRNAEMAAQPALVARGMYGTTSVAGSYEHLLVERFSVPSESLDLPELAPMPMFGQHTRSVLSELGIAPERIDALFEQGVAQASELLGEPTA
ncbi:CoA transferase [Cumulibacter soli]|uniref:CoA transferase n=1 Tax=Cumulibacter soli TaxID=2546344 RepID=UPI0014195607|nr:CoA transferase [Cumulibacter soli]